VFEEKLLGVWVDDPNSPEIVWEFKHPDESKNEYELVVSDKEGNNGVFVACLVKLKDKLFLDVRPDQFPSGKKEAEEMALPYNAFFFVPVHTFIRVLTALNLCRRSRIVFLMMKSTRICWEGCRRITTMC
jgi:hypothetical protein